MADYAGHGGEKHGTVRCPDYAEERLGEALEGHWRFLPRYNGLYHQLGGKDDETSQQKTQIGIRGLKLHQPEHE